MRRAGDGPPRQVGEYAASGATGGPARDEPRCGPTKRAGRPLASHGAATRFHGVVGPQALLPTWIARVVPEASVLIDVRILRLLRVFRTLRLTRDVDEFAARAGALHASRRKILVFLAFVLRTVRMAGTLMDVVEGPEHGFTRIPAAMYRAITP